MGVTSLFKTTTRAESALDGSGGESGGPAVSDFLTVQSLTNFAAMTGAIFIGVINALVLASAVVGASVATRPAP